MRKILLAACRAVVGAAARLHQVSVELRTELSDLGLRAEVLHADRGSGRTAASRRSALPPGRRDPRAASDH